MYHFLVVLCSSVVVGKELLGNHDFENENSISPWQCADCHATVTTSDTYHGQHAVVVNNRHHNWAGLAQSFAAPGGHYYYCSTYIKILNVSSGKSYAAVDLMLQYNNGKDHYVPIGHNDYLMADGTFSEIGGDFHLPNGVNHVRMYVQITDPSVNYVLDYATCQQIVHDPNWKTHANRRIENIRKGTLTINLSGSHNTNGLTVQVHQKKSQFALGTTFNARYVTDSNHAAYQKFLFDNFEWAVPENAMKWKQMEWTRGHINYNTAMDAVKTLKAKGFKVRGHNMFWDDPKRVPDWIKGMSQNDALQVMHKRVNDMISHSMGTLEHWDVNNENLHAHPFEDLVHNPHVSEDMFKWIHNIEPNVKLFLNEYNVINYHQTTTALKTLGKHYKSKGVPIYGLGAQGHFGNSHLSMDVVKYRLDKLAESGLPIWITELTIKETDPTKKAAALDNLMTLFFSHPHVEGVLLWGFWDGAIYDRDLALATGSGVTPNAAGQKWIELFHSRFRTNESHQFNGQKSVSGKAFYGEYQLIFKQYGRIIHTENVSFTHGSKTVTVNI